MSLRPRVTTIVHVPSTLCYHAKIVEPINEQHPLDHYAVYHEFVLRARKWTVETMADDRSGLRALSIDDNTEQDEMKRDDCNTAAYRVWAVTRIHLTEYEASITRDGGPHSFRVSIAHRQGPAVERQEKKKTEQGQAASSGEVSRYQVVAHYADESSMYKPERNVCETCGSGLTKHGPQRRL